ncbi:hypothetical protein ABPG74_019434 [Tetrahymena malaccensis]
MSSEKNSPSPSTIYQFVKVYLISGFSASLCWTIKTPFELIRERIKYQDIQDVRLNQQYKGTFDCFKRILIKEGPQALWKGNLMNQKQYFCTQSLNFALNDAFKRAFNQKYENGFTNWFVTNMIS